MMLLGHLAAILVAQIQYGRQKYLKNAKITKNRTKN